MFGRDKPKTIKEVRAKAESRLKNLASKQIVAAKMEYVDPKHLKTFDAFIKYLKGLGTEKLIQVMNDKIVLGLDPKIDPYDIDIAKEFIQGYDGDLDYLNLLLFPSEFNYKSNIPYPGFLAKALVQSKWNESITDLFNSFYSKERKLDPTAFKIFLEDASKWKSKEVNSQVRDMGFFFNGTFEVLKKQPAIMRTLLTTMPKKLLIDAIVATAEQFNVETVIKIFEIAQVYPKELFDYLKKMHHMDDATIKKQLKMK